MPINVQDYATLKSAGSIVSNHSDGTNITLVAKSFNAMTGAAEANQTLIVRIAAVQAQIDAATARAASLSALMSDATTN